MEFDSVVFINEQFSHFTADVIVADLMDHCVDHRRGICDVCGAVKSGPRPQHECTVFFRFSLHDLSEPFRMQVVYNLFVVVVVVVFVFVVCYICGTKTRSCVFEMKRCLNICMRTFKR